MSSHLSQTNLSIHSDADNDFNDYCTSSFTSSFNAIDTNPPFLMTKATPDSHTEYCPFKSPKLPNRPSKKPIRSRTLLKDYAGSSFTKELNSTDQARTTIVAQNVIFTKRKFPLSTKRKLFRMKFCCGTTHYGQRSKRAEPPDITDVLTHVPINKTHGAETFPTVSGKADSNKEQSRKTAAGSSEGDAKSCTTGTNTQLFSKSFVIPRISPQRMPVQENGKATWLFPNKDISFYLNITGVSAKKQGVSRNKNARTKTNWSKSFCIQERPSYLKPKVYLAPESRERIDRSHTAIVDNVKNKGKEDVTVYQNVLLKNHMLLQKLKAALLANSSKTAEIMFKFLDHYLPSQVINKLSHVEVANFIIYMKQCYTCEAIHSMQEFLKTRMMELSLTIELKITDDEPVTIKPRIRSLTPHMKPKDDPKQKRVPLKEKYKNLLQKLKTKNYTEFEKQLGDIGLIHKRTTRCHNILEKILLERAKYNDQKSLLDDE